MTPQLEQLIDKMFPDKYQNTAVREAISNPSIIGEILRDRLQKFDEVKSQIREQLMYIRRGVVMLNDHKWKNHIKPYIDAAESLLVDENGNKQKAIQLSTEVEAMKDKRIKQLESFIHTAIEKVKERGFGDDANKQADLYLFLRDSIKDIGADECDFIKPPKPNQP